MAHPRASAARRAFLEDVAARCPPGPASGAWGVRVGVDGVDGAGKTVLADELASVLTAHGRTVVRVGEDDFHHPRRIRYARGRNSPDGFLLDSYDDARLLTDVLDPMGPGGAGMVRRAAFDLARDVPVDAPWEALPRGTVLVLDGLFLHRDALVGSFDVTVWVRVPFAVAYERIAARDGCPPDPGAPANARYVGGQAFVVRPG